MTLSGFVAYVKQLWKNKPDVSTPISAERLTHMEDGIKGNSDAIEKIAAAVVNNITNDPNKIASMSAAYNLQDQINVLNAKQELTSIGNAINEDESKWFAVVSNLVMGNAMGILFGEIIHCTSTIPVWGEKIGHFPNMKSHYNIPVLLYDTSGNVLNGVVVKTNGDIMIYNPDYAKLNVKGRRYEFYATYLAEQQS